MSSTPPGGRDRGPVVWKGRQCPPLPSTIVTTKRGLDEVIDRLWDAGTFVVDVETRGTFAGHEYVLDMIERDIAAKVAETKGTVTEKRLEQIRSKVEDDYRKMLALDPLRNEVFWIGFAVPGASWTIPMGHRWGTVIIPEESGEGIPPEGYRAVLKNGSESMKKVKWKLHEVRTEPPKQLERSYVLEALREVFFSDKIEKVNQNIKFDIRSLAKYWGEVPPGPYLDLQSQQHVLNEEMFGGYDLANICRRNFGFNPYERDGKLGKLVDTVDILTASRYLHRDVRYPSLISGMFKRRMRKPQNKGLQFSLDQDMKTLRVIMRSEQEGISVDLDAMHDLRHALQKQLAEVQSRLDEETADWPVRFNPASTAHKRQLLFNKETAEFPGLGLRPVKTTDTGLPSVDADVLEIYEGEPVVDLLLEWAELDKLRGTYVEGVLKYVYDGKVHPSFMLHRTRTGRFASASPNIQNQPRVTGEEGDLGSLVRRMFVAPDGYVLVVLDYSQIEMRDIAALSGDKRLKRTFINGEDIHKMSAAAMLQKDIDDVTKDERQLGKTAGFAIGYGAGADKVAATAVKYGAKFVTPAIAEEAIQNFYRAFPDVEPWKEDVLRFGRKHGYVETAFGRRRRLPDLANFGRDKAAWRARSRQERQAVNFVVQGTAAHQAKEAMINVDALFERDGDRKKLLLQVHDELVSLSPESQAEECREMMAEGMGHESLFRGVPIVAEGSFGKTWADAK